VRIKQFNSNILAMGYKQLLACLSASPYISCLISYRKWLLFGVLASLLIVTPVLAYSYSTQLQVKESGGSNYDELGMTASIDNTYLANNGYIASTGLDTRIEVGGSAIPHIVADDKVLFCNDIPANSTNNFYYSMSNAVLSSFYTITGYDGYITTPDSASIELGNNFEVEQKAYINTDVGNHKNLICKEESFATTVLASQQIASGFITGNDWDSTEQEFNSGVTTHVHCCEIDTNKFVTVYMDGSAGQARELISLL